MQSVEKSKILVLPGYQDSGPDHWQTIWERKHNWHRIQMADWNFPRLNEWVETLRLSLDASGPKTIVVAHSLGVATIAHLVKNGGHPNLAGAFLVAPSDPSHSDFPKDISDFAPMPTNKMPFPSVVVSSSNDPFVSIETAQRFASAWGSNFVDIGIAGHINVTAGFGPWIEGESMLQQFLIEALV